MERELAGTEKRENELRAEVERLKSEVDGLKVSLGPNEKNLNVLNANHRRHATKQA